MIVLFFQTVICAHVRYLREEWHRKADHTLLFADDILVFCKDTKDQMTYLSWILA